MKTCWHAKSISFNCALEIIQLMAFYGIFGVGLLGVPTWPPLSVPGLTTTLFDLPHTDAKCITLVTAAMAGFEF
jgi:hypothetical protein